MDEGAMLILNEASDTEVSDQELCNGNSPGSQVSIHQQQTAHCHDNSHDNRQLLVRSRRKLIIAVILVFCFMFAESIGGIFANSLAIATDAVHLLTDFLGFGINLLSLQIATRKPTPRLNFGWYRIEVLGALLSVLLIWLVTGILVYMAVLRVLDQSYDIDATIMLIMAALGVLFNVMQSLNLIGPHSHGHGHSHGIPNQDPSNKADKGSFFGESTKDYQPITGCHTADNGDIDQCNILKETSQKSYGAIYNNPFQESGEHVITNDIEMEIMEDNTNDVLPSSANKQDDAIPKAKEESINVKAALIHVLGDLAQSFGVLIAAIILYYRPDWKLADPICTFSFSLVVILTTSAVIKDIIIILAEGAPSSIKHDVVHRHLLSLPGVKHVHSLRVWTLTSHKSYATVHVAIVKSTLLHPFDVIHSVRELLSSKYHIRDVTVQVEEYNDVMQECVQCKPFEGTLEL